MIKKYGDRVVFDIEKVYGPIYHGACQGVLWSETF